MPIKQEILQDLARNSRHLSTLDLSNQQLTVVDIQMLLKALVSNTHLARLNLANNKLGDEGACLLASQLRVSELNISHNHISDKGIKAFIENNDVDAINIQGNTYTFATRKRLDQKMAANFQEKISKLALTLSVLAQGRGQVASPLVSLPTELILTIISYLGTNWCPGTTLIRMATIIFNNIGYDGNHQKIFNWKKPMEKLFKFPCFFSISRIYKPIAFQSSEPTSELVNVKLNTVCI
ncbi:hypothetical protein [Legionella brunensis]|uniref:Gala protein type 1, 3 or 4 n=1 Tax=Legionella brunensis TaxID=29422 RepID=A0A0W0S3M1_9GAMM|nr:hypothetical protein [Legionella brunensis]KTC78060.1 Gala protein type 1, 3 or 4 [Legionella brunensis]